MKTSKLISNWKKRTPLLTRLVLWKGFSQVEKALNDYLANLSKLSIPATEAEIMSIVEIAIEQLNVINSKHELIDTLEREDLCEFISKGAQFAGIEIKEDTDITLSLRDW